MAFLIYKKTHVGKNVRYERIQPLKLGGPDGLIARHVQSLPADQTACWKLEVASLLKLAGYEGDHCAVLFDVNGGAAMNVCFYELVCIHGSCRDTSTNLALDFKIVLDRELVEHQPDFSAAFEASPAAMPKKLSEMLALTGGPDGGNWKWDVPALQIGATVVQPHPAGPPGPNCACGRKVATA